jgi:3-deoxy-D-manno-octulosonic-acid transferase
MLRLLNPCIIILMETEIWPNFSRERHCAASRWFWQTDMDRSFPRYLKLNWFSAMSANFTLLCMQTETAGADYCHQCTCAAVVVSGNLRFDIPITR